MIISEEILSQTSYAELLNTLYFPISFLVSCGKFPLKNNVNFIIEETKNLYYLQKIIRREFALGIAEQISYLVSFINFRRIHQQKIALRNFYQIFTS